VLRFAPKAPKGFIPFELLSARQSRHREIRLVKWVILFAKQKEVDGGDFFGTKKYNRKAH